MESRPFRTTIEADRAIKKGCVGKSMDGKKWRYLYPVCGLLFPGEKKKKGGREKIPTIRLSQPIDLTFGIFPNQDTRSFCFLIGERGGGGRKKELEANYWPER